MKSSSKTFMDKTFMDNQVFLNYPFDHEFELLAHAMHFAVIAAGLIPICAKDVNVPDKLRLETLVTTISSCRFSIHDFSRSKGEGEKNLGRFNMPIELGMALFYAYSTEQYGHRCAFFVAASDDYQISHEYQRFASDLAGLDPKHYDDELSLAKSVYEWLREVQAVLNDISIVGMQRKYQDFQKELERIKGSEKDGRPTHSEAEELMYRMCSMWGWWDWRESKWGKSKFRPLPLSWKDTHQNSPYKLLDVDL